MRTPKEIGKDITECKNNLSVLNYELIAYWQEFHAKKHGVIQGNLVSVNGKKYVISGLYSNFYESTGLYSNFYESNGKPWITGFLVKKDGSIGTQTRNLFRDWELVRDYENK